jgi:hypothetical protein
MTRIKSPGSESTATPGSILMLMYKTLYKKRPYTATLITLFCLILWLCPTIITAT